MHLRKVLLAGCDNLAVQIHHDGSVYALPAEHFPQRCTFATSQNRDIPGSSVTQHCRVNQRFMVQELIRYRGLPVAVEQERLAEGRSIDDGQVLEAGPLPKQNLGNRVLIPCAGRSAIGDPEAGIEGQSASS